VLTGTPGNDVICAGDGNDTIVAGAGNDYINAGNGNDVIDAGAGNDKVLAGSGNDNVDAGTDTDKVTGGAGNDNLTGGDGNDNVNGGPGNDVVDGGNGADVLAGAGNNDTVNGGPGNDKLTGAAGVDLLDGGSDTDTLNGGTGDDGFVDDTGTSVTPGTGLTACPLDTTLDIDCVEGTLVTDVAYTASQSAGTATITVNAHVLDFPGNGVTIALAGPLGSEPTHEWTASTTRVGGSEENGDWSATFVIANPPESLAIRVYTPGMFKAPPSWLTSGGAPASENLEQLFPCVSSDPLDTACLGSLNGTNALLMVTQGYPKVMPFVRLGATVPARPSLNSLNFTVAPTMTTSGVAHVNASSASTRKVYMIVLGLRPPAGSTARPIVSILYSGADMQTVDAVVPVAGLNPTGHTFDAPGEWKLSVWLADNSWVVGGPGLSPWNIRYYDSATLASLGLQSTVNVSE
jgi:hypothetical protein